VTEGRQPGHLEAVFEAEQADQVEAEIAKVLARELAIKGSPRGSRNWSARWRLVSNGFIASAWNRPSSVGCLNRLSRGLWGRRLR